MNRVIDKISKVETELFNYTLVGYVGLTLVKMVKYFTKERE